MTAEDYSALEGPRMPRDPDDEEIRKAGRAQFLRRVLLVLLVFATLAFSGGMAFTVYSIRDAQVKNKPIISSTAQASKEAAAAAAAAKRTADRIEDCTTPGGTCFERSQATTGGAIAGINTVTVRAAACLTIILNRVPRGSTVNVDAVANQIQRCIRSSTFTIQPQRLVVPKIAPTPSVTPTPPKHPKHKPKHHKPPKAKPPPNTANFLTALLCYPFGLDVSAVPMVDICSNG